MSSKCISVFTRLKRPCASLPSLDLGLQVCLHTAWILVSRCILEFTQSQSPIASPITSVHILQVHPLAVMGCVGGYMGSGDTLVMEMDRVTGSIYSPDPQVDRHHCISISLYHTMNTYTLSFPILGLSSSVDHFVDTQLWVVSHLLTRFLHSLNLNCYFSWI